MATNFSGAVALCHLFLRERVRPGDRAVDATCGNGRDTLQLARLVGASGRVWAFDIQEQALAATRLLLDREGEGRQVELIQAGHERLGDYVTGPVRAVVFNLGYLPGGDKKIITLPETTVTALVAAKELLEPGGLLLTVIYTGHPGGREEEAAVLNWTADLDPLPWNVWSCRRLDRSGGAPWLLVVEKQKTTG